MKKTMLIKVTMSKGETYVNIDLDDVAKVVVSHSGEPGYRIERGSRSLVILKDKTEYITTTDEAQRVVDFMRKRDEM